MLDITASKVSTPAALFALLSPGLLLQIPDTRSLFTGKTSINAVLVHAMVFMLAYRTIARFMNIILEPADLVVPTVLFLLLSPGMLLTIPPGKAGLFMSGQTSIESILTHTIVFAIVFAFLRKTFPRFY